MTLIVVLFRPITTGKRLLLDIESENPKDWKPCVHTHYLSTLDS